MLLSQQYQRLYRLFSFFPKKKFEESRCIEINLYWLSFFLDSNTSSVNEPARFKISKTSCLLLFFPSMPILLFNFRIFSNASCLDCGSILNDFNLNSSSDSPHLTSWHVIENTTLYLWSIN
jgi:hypothetical protein